MRSDAFNNLSTRDIGDIDRMALDAARAVLSLDAFTPICRQCDQRGDGFDSAALLAEVARIIHREYV